jgi:hypothetical protein
VGLDIQLCIHAHCANNIIISHSKQYYGDESEEQSARMDFKSALGKWNSPAGLTANPINAAVITR